MPPLLKRDHVTRHAAIVALQNTFATPWLQTLIRSELTRRRHLHAAYQLDKRSYMRFFFDMEKKSGVGLNLHGGGCLSRHGRLQQRKPP